MQEALLITFYLCHEGVLRRPLLYLSHYFKQRRAEYYDRLQAIRTEGRWEGWIRFFLTGVATVADEAVATATSILQLRDTHASLIQQHAPRSKYALPLLDRLYQTPVVSAKTIVEALGVHPSTANYQADLFVRLGILRQMGPQQRNRLFVYQSYIDLFGDTSPTSS